MVYGISLGKENETCHQPRSQSHLVWGYYVVSVNRCLYLFISVSDVFIFWIGIPFLFIFRVLADTIILVLEFVPYMSSKWLQNFGWFASCSLYRCSKTWDGSCILAFPVKCDHLLCMTGRKQHGRSFPSPAFRDASLRRSQQRMSRSSSMDDGSGGSFCPRVMFRWMIGRNSRACTCVTWTMCTNHAAQCLSTTWYLLCCISTAR